MPADQLPKYRVRVIKHNFTSNDDAFVGEFDFITIPRIGDLISINEPNGPNSVRVRQGRVKEVFLHGIRPTDGGEPVAHVHAIMED